MLRCLKLLQNSGKHKANPPQIFQGQRPYPSARVFLEHFEFLAGPSSHPVPEPWKGILEEAFDYSRGFLILKSSTL